MKIYKSLMLGMLCLLLSPPTTYAQENTGAPVTYYDGETELEGYWVDAKCELREDAPIVMIVHQWKGLGEYEKGRAEQLAKYCYRTFAIDMYGKGIRPETREEAGAQAGKYKKDPALARGRLQAALDFARTKTNGKDIPVATMGYCFGGTMALEQARSGADIKGAISFHGGLATPAPATKPDVIKASVLVHHGAADPHVPQGEVASFMDEMDNADVDWQLIQYADAVHAFTEKHAGNDPSTGVAYNAKADIRSWRSTIFFLEEIFGDHVFIVPEISEQESDNATDD